jgi:Uma2 family endonuclease
MREIVLPETKPALEWVNGRALQKVSPQAKHALAQGRFWGALDAWAQLTGSGRAGTEWEFRIAPAGEVRRPLVPDVAYLSYARVPYGSRAADIPRVAPDAVVEVLSPRDRKADIESKVRVYLACGTSVVFLVDTRRETVIIRDAAGTRTTACDEIVTHEALSGFAMPARSLFEEPRPKHISRD